MRREKTQMCPRCDGMQRYSERDNKHFIHYHNVICPRCRGDGFVTPTEQENTK